MDKETYQDILERIEYWDNNCCDEDKWIYWLNLEYGLTDLEGEEFIKRYKNG